MFHVKTNPCPRLALLLASSWCTVTALPAFAADSISPLDSPLASLPVSSTSSVAATSPGGAGNVVSAETSQADQHAQAAQQATVAKEAKADQDTKAALADPPTPPSPSQNVTINLINRLVQRGVLSKADASDLIKQAEEDAAAARAQAAAAQPAPVAPPPAPDDVVRVPYIPEIVKDQMRDEIKEEVMTQARDENWADPRTFPDWLTRIKLFGDVRVRYEDDLFPSGNATGFSSNYWNYNAINTGSPFDVKGVPNAPYVNNDQDRDQIRLRARFGVDADLGDGFTSGVRIATGQSDSPVSQNQTLGQSNNGQGGNFSNYAIWLDRGFIKYELGGLPEKDLSFTVGRFDNPFFCTSMIWADQIGFDGFAASGKYQVADGVTPFLTAGAFPVFNTDFNFSSTQPDKYPSEDKWLEAVQGGVDWKIDDDFSTKLAAAYYYFDNIQGEVSDPFTPLSSSDEGDTDDSRPSFAQRGNTYIALRDITANASNDFGTIDQYQYFGLATPFHEFALTGRVDYSHFDPFHISVVTEFVKNLAFDRNAIENNGPANLKGPVNNTDANGNFVGGDTGWIINLQVGSVALENRWDWDFVLGYRYVQSDSVVDGFCDGDFGEGGTNLKGYTIGGDVAFSPRVSMRVRWYGSDSIAGPAYKNDILQVDLNTKF